MATEAGRGEHRVYRIMPRNDTDQGKLTARNHYVGVDAVAWYINKESSWLTDRMASGTLDIKIANGVEHYQAALGTYELKAGAKVAPVFERPVLPDRNYRGGTLTFTASLTAIKKNTVLGGMLKSAASASLNIAAGMVETAALAGPAVLLSTAGADLVDGVKRVLSDTAEKREPLFDFSGFEYTLQPEQIAGPSLFLLFHRGALLDESRLTVQQSGQLLLPAYESLTLQDGAWLLLRVRRADAYSGIRPWFAEARALRARLASLVDDATAGFVDQEAALEEFKPTTAGSKTAFDEFVRLRAVIHADGVLSEREAGVQVGQLRTAVTAAKAAIQALDAAVFRNTTEALVQALKVGADPGGLAGKVFAAEVSSLAAARRPSLLADEGAPRVAPLKGADLFASMKYMPDVLAELVV